MSKPIRVTVWNEFVHERERDDVRRVYPDGLHAVIADGLRQSLGDAAEIRTATLDQPEQGLPESLLEATDVLLWWGHAAHDRVDDALVDRVHSRTLDGMGLLVLHSGHGSKIFRRLMGTSCMLRWREAAEKERLWVVDPSHPILDGLETDMIELEHTEMYGEFFDIPAPDELLMISSFEGGEVFRSACTFRRGKGKIFYFRPGHETYPIYFHPQIRQIIAGGVRWAAPSGTPYTQEARQCPSEPS